jgi:hypothetical protein
MRESRSLPGLSVQHTENNRVTECGESCTGEQIKDRKNELNAKQIERQEGIWQRTLALIRVVPERGLEPPLPCENQVLNLARLPVPPFGHCFDSTLFAPLSATNASRHRNSPHQSSMLRGTRRAGIKNNRQSGQTMQPCTSSHSILIYLSGPAPLVISPILSHSA